MVKMFEEKMSGDGNDPDDLIIQAFKAYDIDGKIDEIFDEFDIDEDYMCQTKQVLGLFVAQKEEKKEEPAAEPEAAPAEADPEDEGAEKKKKKKKKKAAK